MPSHNPNPNKEPQMTSTYKHLAVKPETHTRIKTAAAAAGMTVVDFLDRAFATTSPTPTR